MVAGLWGRSWVRVGDRVGDRVRVRVRVRGSVADALISSSFCVRIWWRPWLVGGVITAEGVETTATAE
jgi:hypothetical protein